MLIKLTVRSTCTEELIIKGIYEISDANKDVSIGDFIKSKCPHHPDNIVVSSFESADGFSFMDGGTLNSSIGEYLDLISDEKSKQIIASVDVDGDQDDENPRHVVSGVNIKIEDVTGATEYDEETVFSVEEEDLATTQESGNSTGIQEGNEEVSHKNGISQGLYYASEFSADKAEAPTEQYELDENSVMNGVPSEAPVDNNDGPVMHLDYGTITPLSNHRPSAIYDNGYQRAPYVQKTINSEKDRHSSGENVEKHEIRRLTKFLIDEERRTILEEENDMKQLIKVMREEEREDREIKSLAKLLENDERRKIREEKNDIKQLVQMMRDEEKEEKRSIAELIKDGCMHKNDMKDLIKALETDAAVLRQQKVEAYLKLKEIFRSYDENWNKFTLKHDAIGASESFATQVKETCISAANDGMQVPKVAASRNNGTLLAPTGKTRPFVAKVPTKKKVTRKSIPGAVKMSSNDNNEMDAIQDLFRVPEMISQESKTSRTITPRWKTNKERGTMSLMPHLNTHQYNMITVVVNSTLAEKKKTSEQCSASQANFLHDLSHDENDPGDDETIR